MTLAASSILALLALGALATACGNHVPLETVNGPCTRTSDCEPGLTCGAKGFCTAPEGGTVDGSGPDANDAGGDAGAAG